MLRPRAHIWIFFIAWLLTSAFGGLLLLKFDPFLGGVKLLATFYFVVFLWVAAGSAIIGYFFRIAFWRAGVRYEFLKTARRQGVWFGLMAAASLFLYSQNIFSIWTGILLIVVLTLVEFYSLAKF